METAAHSNFQTFWYIALYYYHMFYGPVIVNIGFLLSKTIAKIDLNILKNNFSHNLF